MLVGKYIPNLIAKPFQVSREYAQIIYDQTSSPKLDKVLKKWEEEDWGGAANRQQLAYIILVELLAYQFASPVRWIETQDLLFTFFNFERLIELGPSPTLTGMATRTLKAKYETLDGSVSRTRAILCHSKNVKEIYYQHEDEVEAPAAEESASVASTTSAAASAPAAAAPVAIAAPTGPVASIEDVPVKAMDILLVVIAQKLKKQISEIPVLKTIKDLIGGKSTLQNEILGDLQQEFASAPEKGEELPLDGPVRSDGVLLLATTFEPVKRLASEGEAKTWLDGVVSVYAQCSGISLASPGAGGAAGGGGGGAVINSEEFIKFQADQQKFAAQHIELYMRYLGRDSRAGEIAFDPREGQQLYIAGQTRQYHSQTRRHIHRRHPTLIQSP